MGDTIQILSPVGMRRTETRPVAPRIPTLQGKVVGLMDNNKPGAYQLLTGLQEALTAQGVTSFVYRRKMHPAGPSPYPHEIAASCDAAVGALGD